VAELQLDGAELVLHLSGAEKAEAVHGDLRVPLSALRGVEVLDDAHGWTGVGVGFKVGMRVPGVATVATVRGHGEKMFVAVHGDTPRGVRVRLEGAPRGMSGSSAAQIPKPSPPPWRQRVEPSSRYGLVSEVLLWAGFWFRMNRSTYITQSRA
jgi:hypothetical protein